MLSQWKRKKCWKSSFQWNSVEIMTHCESRYQPTTIHYDVWGWNFSLLRCVKIITTLPLWVPISINDSAVWLLSSLELSIFLIEHPQSYFIQLARRLRAFACKLVITHQAKCQRLRIFSLVNMGMNRRRERGRGETQISHIRGRLACGGCSKVLACVCWLINILSAYSRALLRCGTHLVALTTDCTVSCCRNNTLRDDRYVQWKLGNVQNCFEKVNLYLSTTTSTSFFLRTRTLSLVLCVRVQIPIA